MAAVCCQQLAAGFPSREARHSVTRLAPSFALLKGFCACPSVKPAKNLRERCLKAAAQPYAYPSGNAGGAFTQAGSAAQRSSSPHGKQQDVPREDSNNFDEEPFATLLQSWKITASGVINAVVAQLVAVAANFVPANAPVQRLQTAVKSALMLGALAVVKSFISVSVLYFQSCGRHFFAVAREPPPSGVVATSLSFLGAIFIMCFPCLSCSWLMTLGFCFLLRQSSCLAPHCWQATWQHKYMVSDFSASRPELQQVRRLPPNMWVALYACMASIGPRQLVASGMPMLEWR